MKKKLKVTKTQLANLTKLADGLEYHITDEQFDMRQWRRASTYIYSGAPTLCGTVGCAVGWAALFVPTSWKDYDVKDDWTWTKPSIDINYRRYSERVFVSDEESKEWAFLFSHEWHWVDNSRMGCVRRIRRFVARKGVMSEKELQIRSQEEN